MLDPSELFWGESRGGSSLFHPLDSLSLSLSLSSPRIEENRDQSQKEEEESQMRYENRDSFREKYHTFVLCYHYYYSWNFTVKIPTAIYYYLQLFLLPEYHSFVLCYHYYYSWNFTVKLPTAIYYYLQLFLLPEYHLLLYFTLSRASCKLFKHIFSIFQMRECSRATRQNYRERENVWKSNQIFIADTHWIIHYIDEPQYLTGSSSALIPCSRALFYSTNIP